MGRYSGSLAFARPTANGTNVPPEQRAPCFRETGTLRLDTATDTDVQRGQHAYCSPETGILKLNRQSIRYCQCLQILFLMPTHPRLRLSSRELARGPLGISRRSCSAQHCGNCQQNSATQCVTWRNSVSLAPNFFTVSISSLAGGQFGLDSGRLASHPESVSLAPFQELAPRTPRRRPCPPLRPRLCPPLRQQPTCLQLRRQTQHQKQCRDAQAAILPTRPRPNLRQRPKPSVADVSTCCSSFKQR